MKDEEKFKEQPDEAQPEIQQQFGETESARTGSNKKEDSSGENHLAAFVEQVPAIVWATDLDLRITSLLGAGLAFVGEPTQEILGTHITDYAGKTGNTQFIEAHRSALDGESVNYEFNYSGRTYEARLGPLRNERGEIAGAIGVALDITERKRKERRLAAEKQCLAVTFRSIGDGIIATDVQGKIVLLNRAAEKLTGWTQSEAAGKHLNEVFHLVDEKDRAPRACPVEETLEAGRESSFTNHTLLIARDGTERIIGHTAAPIKDDQCRSIGVVLAFRDLTEQRKIEEELRKASKLESLGVLAGGIAHDFNNFLTAMLGNISLAMYYANADARVQEKLREAEQACLRAKDLTRRLLTFARGGAPVKKAVSAARFLEDAASFALTGSNVRCKFDLADDLSHVEIDEGQMRQVIHNIVRNAQEAMPEGGTVTVRAENVSIEKWSPILPLQPARYVMITIRDKGIGIAEANLSKIFDPYFTTKDTGSGLGLSTSYSIIKHHGGHISVKSNPGAGTVVRVYLPASDKEVEEKPEAQTRPRQGRGRILVMDDEEIIRKLCREVLIYFGYEAVVASDGAEAIFLYKQAKAAGEPFDAVIMDLTVQGGMGGKEAIKRLRQIDPDVKAIVSSGYSDDPVMANYRDYGFDGVVAKPYEINDLARVLSAVLSPASNKQ